ncbi:MAG: PLP-dependent aspartate aminotransferase family protein [Deltaproteobacteria bacterium]|jgi:cystathionine beta-lyase/cystathionine gamma-synthase|nr:PLP-dependent aspartate aminotransferase family protein [Deltaproteobacteria bacterium]
MNFDTVCVHGAKDPHNNTGALTVPIYQSATFAHPGVGQSTGYDYVRTQNPTREPLERLVASLEGGREALAFASGMAALDATLTLLDQGDHLIASDDLYGGSVRLFDALARRAGLKTTYVDTGDLTALRAAVRPETRMAFIETPTNPMMKITDIQAARAALPERILLVVDNTFLTPHFQKPLTLGADLVLHSGTKYLAGHNDTLAGFVVTDNLELADKLRFISKTVGAPLAPFDCFLLIRSIKTLALRLEKSATNALTVAKWLANHHRVKKIFYPAFYDQKSQEIAQRQTTGLGAMISFEVDSEATAKRALEKVKLILYAESLGGVETLITYPCLQTHADLPEARRLALGINERLLRLSIGVENPEDLLADLKWALD